MAGKHMKWKLKPQYDITILPSEWPKFSWIYFKWTYRHCNLKKKKKDTYYAYASGEFIQK